MQLDVCNCNWLTVIKLGYFFKTMIKMNKKPFEVLDINIMNTFIKYTIYMICLFLFLKKKSY